MMDVTALAKLQYQMYIIHSKMVQLFMLDILMPLNYLGLSWTGLYFGLSQHIHFN